MSSFQIWCLLQVSNLVGTGAMFYHGVVGISSLFKTVWRRLGIEVMSFWSLVLELVPFLPDIGFQLLKSSWSSLTYFHLMMCQMFSIDERSGLQAGQFSTWTLLLRSHAVVIAAVCGFALSCWNPRRLEGSICCSKIFIYFSIHSAFQKMQAAHTVCTYAPPYHQRCWLLNWPLITRWKVSLLFSRRTRRPWFPTRMSNFELVWP